MNAFRSPVVIATLLALYWTPAIPRVSNALAPCPDSPNCVMSDAPRIEQRVPSIPFTDAPAAAQARVRAALIAEPRTTVVAERDGYLRAECRSLVFRFVDDVEVEVDSTARVFRFRSASRVGRSDLGVNRKRVMRIIARLAAHPSDAAPAR